MEGMENEDTDKVVITGGSFLGTDSDVNSEVAKDTELLENHNHGTKSDITITTQPRPDCVGTGKFHGGRIPTPGEFDDSLCERNWNAGLFECNKQEERHACSFYCCWPYHKYMLSTRLGETPFMALIPCATFALRIKVRTLLGIKGSILRDFWSTLCCEPCAVCQMSTELDNQGL